MPIPDVKGNENQDSFMDRCMGAATDEFDTQEQAVAVCLTKWRDAKGLPQPKAAQVRMAYKAWLFRQLAVYKGKLQEIYSNIQKQNSEEERIEGAPEDLDEGDKSKTGENITDTG